MYCRTRIAPSTLKPSTPAEEKQSGPDGETEPTGDHENHVAPPEAGAPHRQRGEAQPGRDHPRPRAASRRPWRWRGRAQPGDLSAVPTQDRVDHDLLSTQGADLVSGCRHGVSIMPFLIGPVSFDPIVDLAEREIPHGGGEHAKRPDSHDAGRTQRRCAAAAPRRGLSVSLAMTRLVT